MIDIEAAVKNELGKTREHILGFPWEDREAYAMWLVQTFHMVNHSTRLVALAGALTRLDQNELHHRFIDHSKEERGHQIVCVSDLKALGYSIDDFPCLYPSASMYQIQYYWIEHRGPASFFGYTLALEYLAATFGCEMHRRTAEAHGKNASKFLKLHSEDDVEHTQKALERVRELPQADLANAHENLMLSSGLYRTMLQEVRQQYKSARLKRVA